MLEFLLGAALGGAIFALLGALVGWKIAMDKVRESLQAAAMARHPAGKKLGSVEQDREKLRQQFDSDDRSAAGDGGWSTRMEFGGEGQTTPLNCQICGCFIFRVKDCGDDNCDLKNLRDHWHCSGKRSSSGHLHLCTTVGCMPEDAEGRSGT